jgi:hypothetical protein
VRRSASQFVSVVLIVHRMYWMSIGDSPLYHFRSEQMNTEDHSMVPQIDFTWCSPG